MINQYNDYVDCAPLTVVGYINPYTLKHEVNMLLNSTLTEN
jgi:hypothetical protein